MLDKSWGLSKFFNLSVPGEYQCGEDKTSRSKAVTSACFQQFGGVNKWDAKYGFVPCWVDKPIVS